MRGRKRAVWLELVVLVLVLAAIGFVGFELYSDARAPSPTDVMMDAKQRPELRAYPPPATLRPLEPRAAAARASQLPAQPPQP